MSFFNCTTPSISLLLINKEDLVLGIKLVSDQISDSKTFFLETKGSSKKSLLELVEETPKSFLNSNLDMSIIEIAIIKKLFFKLSYIFKKSFVINANRVVYQLIIFVQNSRINKCGMFIFSSTIATMYVATDVIFRFNAFYVF